MPRRTPLIVANWKMHTTLADAMVLATQVRTALQQIDGVEVVLCPPFVWLYPLAEVLHKASLRHLHLGAQNMFWENEGQFTGEVSPVMLRHLAKFVILGHSERIDHFGENEKTTNLKLRAALAHNLKPVVCVGEWRKGENPANTVIPKLTKLFDGVPERELGNLAITYEPVWAISKAGSLNPATGVDAQVVAQVIRQKFGDAPAILYGGSVSPTNALEFLRQPDIDGLLVGTSSLKAATFIKICELAPYD